MGTTLTGTTPQDTYDSLIKVTDNGPLSGTAKYLSDGLGNDSVLALSTTAASITGSLTTTAKTLAERVQVGTAATLNDATGVGNTLQFANYSPSAFVTASADSYIYKNSNAFGGLASQSLVFQTRSDTTGGGFAFVAGGTPAVVATITSAGLVGIGTSTPFAELQVNKASDVTLALSNSTAVTSGNRGSWACYNSDSSTVALIKATAVTDNVGTQLEFYTRPAAGSLAQTMTIDSTGKVGIGTSAPTSLLNLSSATPILTLNQTIANSEQGIEFDNSDTNYAFIRANAQTGLITYAAGLTGGAGYVHRFIVDGSERLRITPDGLTFNGDTAAANALDDYEEGTWTMGVSFGGASVGVTTSSNTGGYTLIGRQVTVTGYLVLTSKGSSTGNARITGLPFTIAGAASNYSAPTLYLENTSFANAFQAFGVNGSTTIATYETTEAGTVTVLDDTNFSDNSAIIVSFTYFV
jgi:hypothetical protein